MMQLYGCDAANKLWVVPGSHDIGKVEILVMQDDAVSDRLTGAMLCFIYISQNFVKNPGPWISNASAHQSCAQWATGAFAPPGALE